MRVITVTPRQGVKATEEAKSTLIEQISSATNRQTPVSGADRASNGTINKDIQKAFYDCAGLLVERKRGEFSDGIRLGYIDKGDVIERNTAMRLVYAALGDISRALVKKVFIDHVITPADIEKPGMADRINAMKDLFFALVPNDRGHYRSYRASIPLLYFAIERYGVPDPETRQQWLNVVVADVTTEWPRLVKYAQREHSEGANAQQGFRLGEWQRSGLFHKHIAEFNAHDAATGHSNLN